MFSTSKTFSARPLPKSCLLMCLNGPRSLSTMRSRSVTTSTAPSTILKPLSPSLLRLSLLRAQTTYATPQSRPSPRLPAWSRYPANTLPRSRASPTSTLFQHRLPSLSRLLFRSTAAPLPRCLLFLRVYLQALTPLLQILFLLPLRRRRVTTPTLLSRAILFHLPRPSLVFSLELAASSIVAS